MTATCKVKKKNLFPVLSLKALFYFVLLIESRLCLFTSDILN